MATSSTAHFNGDDKSKTEAAGAFLMSRMEINDNKAGMKGLDKEKINQVIYEASKGSKFYENERRKEEQLDNKIRKLKLYAGQITPQKLEEGLQQADLLLEKMKFERDLSHTIIHVDMDAFYAAVEMRDDPSLRSKPMAVGGMGMLSTSNYMARKFGVRAAIPGFIAMRLCPNLIIVKPNFDKYTSVSHEIREILALYDPNFCPMSLDEAYLDFGGHLAYRNTSLASERTFVLRQNGDSINMDKAAEVESCASKDKCICDLNKSLRSSILNSEIFVSLIGDENQFQSYAEALVPENLSEKLFAICQDCKKSFPKYRLKVYGVGIEDAVLEMRNRIEQRTSLTASAGIAPNMMLAKICSDINKPNGQFRILPDIEEIENFIHDLPIRKVSGIGKVTERLLGGLDVVKCRDIHKQRSLLYHLFSSISFNHFLRIFLGMGSTNVERDEERKSISTEQTFHETTDVALLCSKCEEMSMVVAEDLKRDNMKGKTVTVKLKTVSFEVKTRSHTLQFFTNDESIIFDSAKKLFLAEVQNSHPAPLKLRLMGVRMSKLVLQNSGTPSINEMFSKYKQKGAMFPSEDESRKWHHHFDNCSLNTMTASPQTELFVPEVEEDEDFSCPINDNPNSPLCQKINEHSCQDQGGKDSKKIRKKTETHSGNILNFFSRHKGRQMKQKECETIDIPENPSQTHVVGGTDLSTSLIGEAGKKTGDDGLKGYGIDSGEYLHPQNTLEDLSPCTSTSTNPGIREQLTCPVCGTGKLEWDLQSLNSHIDACLSQQTIKDILHQEKSRPQQSKRLRTDNSQLDEKHGGKVRKTQSSVLTYFRS